ncbi:hypothetical protein PMAYCL1PPCAC_19179, partial [Pristionchus mayeri]
QMLALLLLVGSFSYSMDVAGPTFSQECVDKCFNGIANPNFHLLEKRHYVWLSFENMAGYPFYTSYASNYTPEDYGTITTILRTHQSIHNVSSMEVIISDDGNVIETVSAPGENTQGEAPSNKQYQEAACVWNCINGGRDTTGILTPESRIYDSKVGDDYSRLTARIDEGGDFVTVVTSTKKGLSLRSISDQTPPITSYWHHIMGPY